MLMIKEPMAIFIAWVEIYSAQYFCCARVGGLGEIFVQRNFSAVQYFYLPFPCPCPAAL